MSTDPRCPHCGHLVHTRTYSGDTASEVIDSLSREIDHLRLTVARLRGGSAGNASPMTVPARPVTVDDP